MKQLTLLIILFISVIACSRHDATRIVRAAATGNPVSAAESIATSKAISYASNPKSLERDLTQFKSTLEHFIESIQSIWGDEDTRLPLPKVYVKYTQNYLSRADVDFDKGIITVETIATKTPLTSLKNAIVTTLLTPADPRAVDLYSDKTVKLGDTPFLLGEVKDNEHKNIRWAWRAERFADYLIANQLQTRTAKGKTVRYVTIQMERDHLDVRAKKYSALVHAAAQRFGVSKNLIYAIMKVESDFNPFALSHAMAVGLMQVVPRTAGGDVYKYLHNRKGYPSREDLFHPPTNITYGTAYLHLLDRKYLANIHNPISREYCVIAGYNGGAGGVLRIFNQNKQQAARRINALSPAQVYDTLRNQHPYAETRRYLRKVLEAKKHFVNFKDTP